MFKLEKRKSEIVL